jgi:serine/threonine-protein kinase
MNQRPTDTPDNTTPRSDIESLLHGRYRVERLLGRGGMGAVHLARDLQLDRLVAIKELPSEFAQIDTLRERFVREVRMAASFSHPNIVPVYAVEDHGNTLAFVMGFVEGESLAERVKRTGPLTSREAIRLLLDVAYALAYAHGRGVVHRDIKPDNIMIERATGRALIMDFGVARTIEPTASEPGMTRVGEVVGTPEYMSPEQATGDILDERSDLYSLGLAAYYALTGTKPFAGDSAARILVRQLTEALPPLQSVRGDIPPALGAAIDKCLEKDKELRFANAAALIEALDAAQAAAPEVPLAVRLFAQEAEVLGLILFIMAMFLFLFNSAFFGEASALDKMIPVVVMVAVMFGRIAQTRSEAVRLVAQGFDVDTIMRGLHTIMDERRERREQLRADPATVMRRKKTVRVGIFMVVTSVVLAFFALQSRSGTPGNYQTPTGGIVMLFSGLACMGFAVVLLVRSPLRMPIAERVFRRTWLGAFGRWFFRTAAAAPAAAGTAMARGQQSITISKAISTEDRVAALEARLARLEKRAADA